MKSRLWTPLLEWAARRLDTPDLPGDLRELHARRAERTGLRAADRWYRRQIRMAVWRALWIRGADGGSSGGSGRRSVASRVTAIVRETHLALRRVRRRPAAALTFAFVVGTGITAVAFMVQTRADILDPARRLAVEAELVAWVSDEGEASTRVALRGSEAWLADPPAAVEAVAVSWNRRTRIESPGGLIRTSGERVLTGHLGRFEASAWIGRDAVRPGEVVLEHGFWRSRFEADVDMVGRTVLFDGEPVRVVGVAPPGWAGPHCCVPPSFWLVDEPTDEPAPGRVVVVGLRNPAAAEAWLAAATAASPGAGRPVVGHPAARTFGGETGVIGRVLSALVALAALVWVTTVLSGANLLLADTVSRRSEIRVRGSLGADRTDTLTGALTESGLRAVLGAAAAVLATAALTRVAPWLLPILGSSSTIRVSVAGEAWGVVALAAALSALLCAAPSIVVALRLTGRPGVDRGSAARGRAAGLGLVGQVALAAALLTVTGTLVDEIHDLDGDFIGFRNGRTAAHFVSAQGGTPSPTTGERRGGVAPGPGTILDALEEGLPGGKAALTARLPVYGARRDSVAWEGGGERFLAAMETVTPEFFEVLGTRLVRGRAARGTAEAVVSEDVARRVGGPDAALRSSIRLDDTTSVSVVGVVESASWGQGEPRATIYQGWGERPVENAVLLVGARSPADPTPSVGEVLAALRTTGTALEPFETLDGLLVRSRVLLVFLARLATAFGVLALLVGIGAVHAHFQRWTRSRRREFAIRAALGAPATRLGRRLGRVAFLHVVPGLLAGLALGALAVRVLSGYLGWPFPIFVPGVAAGVAALLGVATAVSLAGPLVRTGRVAPRAALQEG